MPTARVALRLCAIATGLLLGMGLGLMVSSGNFGATFMTFVVGAMALAARLAPPSQRTRLLIMLGIAFALRVACAATLDAWVAFENRPDLGVVGDDGAYARLSWAAVEYIHGKNVLPNGPPYWYGEEYLFGTYVYLEMGLLFLFGHNILVVDLMNVGFAIVMIGLLFDTTRHLFGDRAAWTTGAVVSFYPSLVVWSSINLKDSLALLLLAATLCVLVRFAQRPRWIWLVVLVAMLLPMETLRRYLFIALAIVLPVAVWVAPRLTARARLLSGVSITLVCATLVSLDYNSTLLLRPSTFASIEIIREAQTLNANSAFVANPPLKVHEGDTFVVPGPQTGNTVVAEPGSRVVVEAPSSSAQPSRPGVVVARPGDLVVFGKPDTTPQPLDLRHTLAAPDGGVQSRPADNDTVGRNVGYLPQGLTYVVLAPFPWALRRIADAATIPEMLAWYVLQIAAVATLWRERRRWRELVPFVIYAGGMYVVLALFEGNVGTLFRHRAMLIPTVIVLGAPSLVLLWPRLRGQVALGTLAFDRVRSR
ncbi:MAG: glycosyltransferase family 39 protein [Chloroflexi bacterium]|nr:glycosyltransferase family 39 protein [Chloroflexota bacterium]